MHVGEDEAATTAETPAQLNESTAGLMLLMLIEMTIEPADDNAAHVVEDVMLAIEMVEDDEPYFCGFILDEPLEVKNLCNDKQNINVFEPKVYLSTTPIYLNLDKPFI